MRIGGKVLFNDKANIILMVHGYVERCIVLIETEMLIQHAIHRMLFHNLLVHVHT